MSTSNYSLDKIVNKIIVNELERFITLDKQFKLKNRKVINAAKILLEFYSITNLRLIKNKENN